MNFRPFDLAHDYATYERWCKAHNSEPFPSVVLPRGWIAHASGIEIAMSFLYADPGKVGVIELTTTNPSCSFSRDMVAAVKGLYELLQAEARKSGCLAVISFVKPNSFEERTMIKMGFATSPDAVPHKMYAKPLVNLQEWNPPKDGVMSCPSP